MFQNCSRYSSANPQSALRVFGFVAPALAQLPDRCSPVSDSQASASHSGPRRGPHRPLPVVFKALAGLLGCFSHRTDRSRCLGGAGRGAQSPPSPSRPRHWPAGQLSCRRLNEALVTSQWHPILSAGTQPSWTRSQASLPILGTGAPSPHRQAWSAPH